MGPVPDSGSASDVAQVGAVLASKYRVDAVLGSGGMGIVLAATHLQLQERFAIKLLHPEASLRSDAVGRFLREARVAMRLRGEHVVRIFDVGTLDDGSPFIAMECLEGRDLRAVIAERGAVAPKVAVDYLLQACEAIAEAHALGVIHRDLKPANLFLTERPDGTPSIKVLDFGISKIGGALAAWEDLHVVAPAADLAELGEGGPTELAETLRVASAGMTRTRALLGSPKYMAPEQLRSPRDVDVRADVWALGTILFELLAGEPPFEGDTLDELRRAVTSAPAPPLHGVSPELEWAVNRCLAKEPRQRFGAVAELASALAPFASEEGIRCVERIGRIARATPSVAPPAAPHAAGGGAMTEDAVVDTPGRRPTRAAWMTSALFAVAVVVVGAALIREQAVPIPPESRRDAAAVTALLSSATLGTPSGRSEMESARPLAEPQLTAVPIHSLAPVPAPPHRAHPMTTTAPVAAVVARAAPASAAAATDPLRLDAGLLFDERK